MADYSQDRKNFDQWFTAKLTPLLENPDGGFVCAIVAFPLLERYLTRETGRTYKTAAFRDALVRHFQELGTRDNAKEFWELYRHGLLHNIGMKERVWLSHLAPIIEIRPGGFWMNPRLFLKRVLDIICTDFDTFAKPPGFPQVKSVPMQTLAAQRGSHLGLQTSRIGTGSG